MSDATSTIKLGVDTKQAATNLDTLRKSFADLRKEVEGLNALKAAASPVEAGAKTAVSAVDTLTNELTKATNKIASLEAQIKKLTTTETAAFSDVAKAAKDSEDKKTKAAEEGARRRKQIADQEESEEKSRKIRMSQNVRLGGTSNAASEGSTEDIFRRAQETASKWSVLNAQIKGAHERNAAAIATKQAAEAAALKESVAMHNAGLAMLNQEVKARKAALIQRQRDAAEATAIELAEQMKAQQLRLVDLNNKIKASQAAHAARVEAARKAAADEQAAQEKTFKAGLALLTQEIKERQAAHAAAQASAVESHNARLKLLTQEIRERQSAHKQRMEQIAAEREAERQATLLNTRYARMGNRQKAGVLEAVSALNAIGEVDFARQRFGSAAIGDLPNLAKLRQEQENGAKSSNSHTEALRRNAIAMNEAHSAARGLAGGLNMLWVTWGSTVPLLAGAAISATLRGIYEEGRKVEFQLAFVKALSQSTEAPVSAGQLEHLIAGTTVGLTDAANGMRMLKQAGLSTKETLAALPSVLNLATIGEMTLAEAAAAATGTLKAFNLEVTQSDRVTDVMAKAASSSNASVQDMVQSFKYAAPAASQYGLSLEETAAHLALLSEQNIKGSMAGTTFVNMMNSLRSPTAQASKAFEQLGVDIRGMQNRGLDSLQILDELRKKISTLDAASRADFISKITDVRGAREFNIMMDGGLEKTERIRKELASADGFARQAVLELQNTVEASSLRMRQALSGAFTHAFGEASGPLQQFQDTLAAAFRSEGFRAFVDQMATGLVALTRTLRDHGQTLVWIIGIYGSFKVLSGVTARIEGMKVAFDSASAAIKGTTAATATATAVTTAQTVATAAAGAGALTAAGALRTLGTALTVGVPLVGTLLTIAATGYSIWTMFKSGVDEARNSQDQYNTSAGNTISMLEKQLDQLRNRNKLLREGKDVNDPSVIAQSTVESNLQDAQRREKAYRNAVHMGGNNWKVDLDGKQFTLGVKEFNQQWTEAQTNVNRMQTLLTSTVDETLTNRNLQVSATLRGAREKLEQDFDRTMKGLKTAEEKNKLIAKYTESWKMLNQGGGSAKTVTEAEELARNARTIFDQGKVEMKFGTGDRAGVNALVGAENNAILETFRNRERMAKMARDTEVKMADDALKAKLISDLEYLQRRRQAQKDYEQERSSAQDEAISKIGQLQPLDSAATEKRLQTEVERLKNMEREQGLQDALNERYRIQADLNRTLGDARKYAEETLPAQEAANARANAIAIEAYGLSLLTEEERRVAEAKRNVAAEYTKQEDSIKNEIALVNERIRVAKEVADSVDTTPEEKKTARDALSAEQKKIDALNKSLALNRLSASSQTAAAVAAAKQVNEQNKWNTSLNLSIRLASTMESAFGKAGKAVGDMITGFMEYGKAQDDIQKRLEEQKKETDPTEYSRLTAQAMRDSEEASARGYANMLSSAKGFFDQSSSGYQALQAAEQAFRIYQMAMELKSFSVKTGFLASWLAVDTATKATATTTDTSFTIASITNSTLRAGADGIAAIAKAIASLPFPLNLAAGAATAAALISAGVAVTGGAGSGAVGAAARQEKQGTGTVFGDEGAKSESISKSIEELEKNSDIALKHSSGMLASLRVIEANIGGLANMVISAPGLRGTRTDIANLNLKQPSNFVSSILGGKRQTLMDSGLSISAQTLGQALSSGVSARTYAEIESVRKVLGVTVSRKRSVQYGELDQDLKDQLTAVLDEMAEGVVRAATSLGRSSTQVQDALNAMTIPLSEISFNGLTGEEIQAELEAIFSSLGDSMVEVGMAGLGLEAFRKAGEGLLQTAARVVVGIDSATYALEQLGVTAIDYTSIRNKQGDVATEMARDSIVGRETTSTGTLDLSNGVLSGIWQMAQSYVTTGIGQIIDEFTGSASELVETYRDLVEARRMMNASGLNGNSMSRDIIRGAGGLDRLIDGLESYQSRFFTTSQRTASETQRLNGEFTRLGVTMPTTREGFKEVLTGLDTTNEANARLAGGLIVLSDSFADLMDAAEALSNQREDLEIRILELQGDKSAALARIRGREIAAMDESLHSLQLRIYQLEDEAEAAEAAAEAAEAASRLNNQRQELHVRIMELQGNKALATAVRRGMEVAAMDASLVPLQLRIYQLEDEAVAMEAANKAVSDAKDTLQEAYDDAAGNLTETRDKFKDLAKSLREVRDGMLTGSMSYLSPEAKYLETKSQFDRTYALALSGDPEAMSALSDISQQYLDASKDYYASSLGYTEDFMKVRAALENAANSADTQATIAEQSLAELKGMVDGIIDVEKAVISVREALANYLSAVSAASRVSTGGGSDILGNSGAGNNSAYTHPSGVNVTSSDSAVVRAAKVVYQSMVGGVSTAQYNAAVSAIGGVQNLQGVGDPAAMRSIYKFAKGGVFTNGVVSQPTMFNMGQMGEKDPEAIVPLIRTPDGLGVRSVGGGDNSALIAVIGELVEELRAANVINGQVGTQTLEKLEKVASNIEDTTRAVRAQ